MERNEPGPHVMNQIKLLRRLNENRLRLQQQLVDHKDEGQAIEAYKRFRTSLDEVLQFDYARLQMRPPQSDFPPYQLPPPYGVPVRGGRIQTICNLNAELIVDTANYWDDGGTGGGGATFLSGKSARGSVWSHPITDPGPETVTLGFISTVQVPAAQGTTSIVIQSILDAGIGWAEANTYPGTYAHIYTHCGLTASFDNQPFFAPIAIVLDYMNNTPGTVIPSYQFGWDIGRSLSLNFTVPPGAARTITITEWATMQADASNGFASLSIGFTWAPLVITMREGCRTIQTAEWGYWSGGRIPDQSFR